MAMPQVEIVVIVGAIVIAASRTFYNHYTANMAQTISSNKKDIAVELLQSPKSGDPSAFRNCVSKN